MMIRRIEGANTVLGPPKNWNEDLSGKCVRLPVRVLVENGHRIYESAWEPDPLELKALNAEGSIVLRSYSGQYPVTLYVTESPSEDEI